MTNACARRWWDGKWDDSGRQSGSFPKQWNGDLRTLRCCPEVLTPEKQEHVWRSDAHANENSSCICSSAKLATEGQLSGDLLEGLPLRDPKHKGSHARQPVSHECRAEQKEVMGHVHATPLLLEILSHTKLIHGDRNQSLASQVGQVTEQKEPSGGREMFPNSMGCLLHDCPHFSKLTYIVKKKSQMKN